jgi:transposase
MSSCVAVFSADHQISDEDWANTPESVRRGMDWLLRENAKLREQAGQSSRNSSLPPSKDKPQHQRPRRQRCTARQPGGQPGHPGVTRPLVPVADLPTPPVAVFPDTCACGHAFLPDAPLAGAPYRHQVWEVPPVTPILVEYQLHHRTCPDCGTTVRAPYPAGVPTLTLGPQAQAVITTLTGQYHLAKRAVSRLLRDLFGIPVAAATVCAVEQAISRVLAEPVAAVRTAVVQAPWKHIDESGWRQRHDPDPGQPDAETLTRPWLWSVTTPDATVYLIRRGRNQAVARDLLGVGADATAYDAIVTSDRHSAYNFLPLSARQLCWAHLDRDFLAVSERQDPTAARIGTALLAQADRLFAAWQQYRDGLLTFAALGATLAPVRAAVLDLLRDGHHADAKTKTFCHNLREVEPALWTFLRVEGVEPTNNAAERAQRKGVMKRDRTFGTQTSAGSRFVERILTTVATCQQQEVNVLTYLTDAILAHLTGRAIPPLLPA